MVAKATRALEGSVRRLVKAPRSHRGSWPPGRTSAQEGDSPPAAGYEARAPTLARAHRAVLNMAGGQHQVAQPTTARRLPYCAARCTMLRKAAIVMTQSRDSV